MAFAPTFQTRLIRNALRKLGRALRPPTAAGTSTLRIQLCYLWRHRRLARLSEPRLLTEWVQHRKLNDRDPRLPVMADKAVAKEKVGKMLGAEWVIPTLWSGTELPKKPAWPFPYVVKSRHGSQQVQVVRNEAEHALAVVRSGNWMKLSYGAWLDEWLYGAIPRGLLVEPFIGTGGNLPIDYKLFVFGGVVRYIQVHLDRANNHRWIVMDRNWRRVSLRSEDADPTEPVSLPAMIEAAELLAAPFPFVRADFYEAECRPLFGEMTFYPVSGLEPVEPLRLDLKMGMLWAAALVTDIVQPAL